MYLIHNYEWTEVKAIACDIFPTFSLSAGPIYVPMESNRSQQGQVVGNFGVCI